jgi:hypothetical protein
MAFNGSGTFLINTAGQPVVAGTVISSTAFNALTADLATGLSTAITKDGQTTVTANIPMSTYKFTGLGVGSAAGDSANLSQVQSTVTKLLTSVSGTDTITAVGAPVVAAYAAGQMFYFVATGDNTGAVTLNIDALGAKAVTRDGSVALAAGDIKSGEVVVVVYDGTRFQVVSQLNSAGDARFANVSIASSLYVGGVSTFVGNAGFSANVSIASALSVGGVAAITGATTIGGNLTLNGGTANGVLFLNGSKVATSGTALVFDGAGVLTVGSDSVATVFNAPGDVVQYVVDSNGAGATASHQWRYGSTEAMRLNATGLGIGTSSPGCRLNATQAASAALGAQIALHNNAATAVGNAVEIALLTDAGASPSGIRNARIRAVNENVGNGAANMQFWTWNGSTDAERARITSGGVLLSGKTTDDDTVKGIAINGPAGELKATNTDNTVVIINRQTNDGVLVSFRQANAEEGTISVSGATVSYNAFAGSHWSQLQDGSKPDILRGTVMESINELCVWPDEQNERLPKSKVSDTAGSKKVYGVFMAWDNDWATTNDMYVTAVGAFICRVNASVTVQEGDLLESNGDGTARVQADDIVRSSTIGKVTSTVKTHQYDDGSYCVPTVLYCG